jgi:hypothetical protein
MSKNTVKGYYREDIINKFSESLAAAKEMIKNGEDLHVKISKGNRKMGEVPSVSTLPFLTCPGICSKSCGVACYAAKIANLYKNVMNSYAINTALALYEPEKYWNEINNAVKGYRFFRFHVSGDIINYDYFVNMVKVAVNNPRCDILVFTKRYEIVNKYCDENGGVSAIPENLHILFSGWINLTPVNPYNFPETNIFDNDHEPEENWLICGGNCFNCGCAGLGCWKAAHGETVAFKKH